MSVGKSQLDKMLEKVPPTAKMTPTSKAKTEMRTGREEANIITVARVGTVRIFFLKLSMVVILDETIEKNCNLKNGFSHEGRLGPSWKKYFWEVQVISF